MNLSLLSPRIHAIYMYLLEALRPLSSDLRKCLLRLTRNAGMRLSQQVASWHYYVALLTDSARGYSSDRYWVKVRRYTGLRFLH